MQFNICSLLGRDRFIICLVNLYMVITFLRLYSGKIHPQCYSTILHGFSIPSFLSWLSQSQEIHPHLHESELSDRRGCPYFFPVFESTLFSSLANSYFNAEVRRPDKLIPRFRASAFKSDSIERQHCEHRFPLLNVNSAIRSQPLLPS